MKTAKRILSLLLALMMVFALVACGGDGDDTAKKPDQGNNPSGPSGSEGNGGIIEDPNWKQKPISDMSVFKDKTYKVIQHSAEETPFGYGQDSAMGTKVADRLTEVQAKYGCVIEFVQVDYANFASDLPALMYTANAGDIVFSNNNAQLRKTLGTGGDTSYMQDILAYDDILNFWNADRWGNITSRETMMAGGTFYGITPALWVDCTPLPYYQLVYNKDLIDSFGTDNPQELWEQEAWDREAMLDIITSCYDDSTGDAIWGMTACQNHMVRATALTTGISLIDIKEVNVDGTVEWSIGLANNDVIEALTWLKNSVNSNRRYFNNGAYDLSSPWTAHPPFIAGQTTFCLTRPLQLFGDIVTQCENFGLITWAGYEANVLSGYYENCYSVAIPVFAQSGEQSAYLIYDLFAGLSGEETLEDVMDYYRTNYFESDVDMTCLVRDGATFQYSYWPNGVDDIWPNVAYNLFSASSVSALIEKYEHSVDTAIEENVIPNQVKLEQYREAGYIK